MHKKNLIILSIIISILTLIYLLLDYYGYIRNAEIRVRPLEYYVKEYPSKKTLSSDRMIISFDEPRKKLYETSFQNCLKSLLDQNVRVNDIGVTVKKNPKHQLPETLYGVLNVYNYVKEYGNATNSMLALMREPSNNTTIIIINNLQIYSQDYIENLVKFYEKDPKNNYKDSHGNYIFRTNYFNVDNLDNIHSQEQFFYEYKKNFS